MTYKQYFLKADSESDFALACEAAGLVNDGAIATTGDGYCLFAIGTIMTETGSTLQDEDGIDYNERKPVDGYHANLYANRDIGIEHLAIDVDSPKFNFSGAE